MKKQSLVLTIALTAIMSIPPAAMAQEQDSGLSLRTGVEEVEERKFAGRDEDGSLTVNFGLQTHFVEGSAEVAKRTGLAIRKKINESNLKREAEKLASEEAAKRKAAAIRAKVLEQADAKEAELAAKKKEIVEVDQVNVLTSSNRFNEIKKIINSNAAVHPDTIKNDFALSIQEKAILTALNNKNIIQPEVISDEEIAAAELPAAVAKPEEVEDTSHLDALEVGSIYDDVSTAIEQEDYQVLGTTAQRIKDRLATMDEVRDGAEASALRNILGNIESFENRSVEAAPVVEETVVETTTAVVDLSGHESTAPQIERVDADDSAEIDLVSLDERLQEAKEEGNHDIIDEVVSELEGSLEALKDDGENLRYAEAILEDIRAYKESVGPSSAEEVTRVRKSAEVCELEKKNKTLEKQLEEQSAEIKKLAGLVKTATEEKEGKKKVAAGISGDDLDRAFEKYAKRSDDRFEKFLKAREEERRVAAQPAFSPEDMTQSIVEGLAPVLAQFAQQPPQLAPQIVQGSGGTDLNTIMLQQLMNMNSSNNTASNMVQYGFNALSNLSNAHMNVMNNGFNLANTAVNGGITMIDNYGNNMAQQRMMDTQFMQSNMGQFQNFMMQNQRANQQFMLRNPANVPMRQNLPFQFAGGGFPQQQAPAINTQPVNGGGTTPQVSPVSTVNLPQEV